jgi:hypothetical protein
VALNSRRAFPLSLRRGGAGPAPRTARRSIRAVAAASAVGLGLGLAACGLDVQTNKPYTPADGVSLDAGNVHIRNVLVFSRTAGSGYLAGSLVTSDQDALTGVSGVAIKPDGSNGAALVATMPDPVAFGNNTLVVLTNRPLITITSADLKAGLDASLVLQFSKAGQVSVRVPIIDGNQPQYATISPTPSATPSS